MKYTWIKNLLKRTAVLLVVFMVAPHMVFAQEQDYQRHNVYFLENNACSPSASTPTAATSTSGIGSGSSVYILGDSITVGAESAYRSSFTEKGITPVINAAGSRSWNGGGQGAPTAEGSLKAAKDAVGDDMEKIRAAGGIIVALGSNGGKGSNPVPEVIDRIRGINAGAPIWWVNTVGTDQWTPSLSYLGDFNLELTAQAAVKNFTVISWARAVNPTGDPNVMPTTDDQSLLSDGLHPNTNGINTLVNLVVNTTTGGVAAPSTTPLAAASCCPTDSSSGTVNATKTESMNQFIDKYGQAAFNVGKQFGIPYEAILAQAALESGYGGSSLTERGFNFFGMKAGSSWTGPVIELPTKEQRPDGSEYTVVAKFRSYANAEEGFRGYGEFITNTPRYSNALNYPGDPIRYIEEIKAAGYATDVSYVSKLTGLINAAKLYIQEKNLFPPSSEVTPDVAPPQASDTPVSRTGGCAGESSAAGEGGSVPANKTLGQQLASEKGWTGPEWVCLEKLWTKESGWNHRAINDAERNNDKNGNRLLDDGEDISDTESDAYGIPQALPGGKMATVGADWKTSARTQIIWGLGYIAERYTTPCGAWSHSESNNWY